jgi:hypothetical protein
MAGRECITPVVAVAKLLMEKGVDVNVVNSEGSTPLVKFLLHHIAVIAEFVPALLCFGPDPECLSVHTRNTALSRSPSTMSIHL